MDIETNRTWNVKTKVVPVVVGALGTLRKDFTKGVELTPGRPKVSEIQQISLLDTAHILRKVLGWITKRTGSAPGSSFPGWKAKRNNVKIQ